MPFKIINKQYGFRVLQQSFKTEAAAKARIKKEGWKKATVAKTKRRKS